MFFSKKGKVREKEDANLLWHLAKLKKSLNQREALINNSVDQNNQVIYQALTEKAKYLFLLKEARIRKTKMRNK
ncbi:YaaL family protein [Evansella cellulosilytica]|uniref:DUF2508 family protein n=1 Tax=Evansella cellulosilytica (strain ATCC 21833 / DSM 2522 / FERM P-1141 / JCM 9156 / N-4) TaxID=649639 RepID=E6TRM4_EVAC2|nr:YaaL family protein [Evansella cellulosilytica]ADU28318.1 Protein of unknown function DUF2508 [Evansella cellulosilytica DSM 2522]